MKVIFLFFLLIPLDIYSHEREIFLAEFSASNSNERSIVGNLVHLDGFNQSSVYSYISKADLEVVKKYIPFMLEKVTPIHINKALSSEEEEFPTGDEKFHTFEEMKNVMYSLEEKFPRFVKVLSIGESIQGRDILMLKITDLEQGGTRPSILFTGSHHAREHLSTEVPLLIAKRFIESINENKENLELVKNSAIYFIPMVNPDGAMHDIRGKQYKIWRKNMRASGNAVYGVDLNRNYSHGWGGPGSSERPASDIFRGFSPFSEPETMAIKNFVEKNPELKIILSFHSFSELILYPWGNTKEPIKDEAAKSNFVKMAEDMSKWNGYRPMQASELYVASGDTCDWAWAEHQIYCFTFELSPKYQWGPGGFYPGAKAIDPAVQANYEPARYLIKKLNVL